MHVNNVHAFIKHIKRLVHSVRIAFYHGLSKIHSKFTRVKYASTSIILSQIDSTHSHFQNSNFYSNFYVKIKLQNPDLISILRFLNYYFNYLFVFVVKMESLH